MLQKWDVQVNNYFLNFDPKQNFTGYSCTHNQCFDQIY